MKKMHLASLSAVVLGCGLALQASADDAGRNLAATCTTCHGKGASATGALDGRPKSEIVQTMKDFKSGARPATLMHQLAKGYTEQQVALIAEYFSQQKAR